MTTSAKPCALCGSTATHFQKNIFGPECFHIELWCEDCNDRGHRDWFRKELFSREDLERMPIVDRTTPGECERCHVIGAVERHHWAPKKLFGHEEAERWPKADLCRECHMRWHDTIERRIGRNMSPDEVKHLSLRLQQLQTQKKQ